MAVNGKLCVAAAAVLGLILWSSSPATAGCWDCQMDVGVGAFVCHGVDYGTEGWTECTPEWINDEASCKFDGEFGLCTGQPHCPGCLRYPAVTVGKERPSLTTQILVYQAAAGGMDARSLAVSEVTGLSPAGVADQLRPASGGELTLVAYSVQSSRQLTSTRYRPTKGAGTIIVANATEDGIGYSEYAQGPGEHARPTRRMHVRANEAAVLPVELDGKTYFAVVYSVLTPDRGDNFHSIISTLHDPFTKAAEGLRAKALLPVQVDAPRAFAVGVDSWAMRALADNALSVGMREHH